MDKQKLSLLGSAGVGAGLGAGLMYLLDPQGGGQRRAVARDKTVSALKTGGNAALKTGKHLGNRTKGLVAEAGSRLRRETVDEQVLGDGKSRSRLARVWKPATLILAGTGGAALAVAGFKRRDKVGAALGAAGLGILANSFARGRDKDVLSEGDGSVGLSSSQPSSHSGGLDNLDHLEDPGLQSALREEDAQLQTTLP